MQTPSMAEHAVHEQHLLNRIGAEIYVNYSNKVSEIRMPSEKGLNDDGLSKDFTYIGQGPFFQGGNHGPFNASGWVCLHFSHKFVHFSPCLFTQLFFQHPRYHEYFAECLSLQAQASRNLNKRMQLQSEAVQQFQSIAKPTFYSHYRYGLELAKRWGIF